MQLHGVVILTIRMLLSDLFAISNDAITESPLLIVPKLKICDFVSLDKVLELQAAKINVKVAIARIDFIDRYFWVCSKIE